MTTRTVFLVCLLLCVGFLYQTARAESEAINLSRSAGAIEPQLIIGPEDELHAIWRDEQRGFMYTRQVNNVWQLPSAANLPFITELRTRDTFELISTTYYEPRLLLDGNGAMHGIWIDEDQTLLHSQVSIEDVADWRRTESVVTLADDVLAVDLTIDRDGNLIVAYIASEGPSNGPAGLYTMVREATNRRIWEEPVLQYESSYYRATDVETLDVKLAYEDSTHRAILVWEDPLLERLYYLDSADSGITWSSIVTVDSRQEGDALASPRPSNLEVAIARNQIHLVWQAGHASVDCTLFHQWSGNSGVTWRRMTIETNFTTCPEDKHLLLSDDGTAWLFVEWEGDTYQLVWKPEAERWSIVAPFTSMDQFTDPDRVRSVRFRCRQPILLDDVLITIGCDEQIEDKVEIYYDIWLTEQPLDRLEFVFKETVWSEPAPIASQIEPLESLNLLPVGEKSAHGYWAEGASPADQHIRYSFFDGANWTAPASILKSPAGQTNQPSMAFDEEGRLYAAWRGADDGRVFVSRTESIRAASASEWKEPVALPMPNRGSSHPQIVVGADGRVSVAFVIEVNEQRGVYISHSADLGETWSTPIAIVRGAEFNWERLTKPTLLVSASGRYHLMWHNDTNPAGIGTVSLHYGSSDNGTDWRSLSIIIDANADWSKQLIRGDHIYQVWQFQNEIQYRESRDDGATWSRVESVSRLAAPLTLFDVTLDAAGDLHVVQGVGASEIQQLGRQNGRWQIEDRTQFSTALFDPESRMVLATLGNEKLLTAQVGVSAEGDAISALPALFYTQRDFSVDAPTAEDELIQDTISRFNLTPTPTIEPELVVALATLEPTATPRAEFSTQPAQGASLPLIGSLPTDRNAMFALAVIPSALFIVGVAVIIAVRMRRN